MQKSNFEVSVFFTLSLKMIPGKILLFSFQGSSSGGKDNDGLVFCSA